MTAFGTLQLLNLELAQDVHHMLACGSHHTPSPMFRQQVYGLSTGSTTYPWQGQPPFVAEPSWWAW